MRTWEPRRHSMPSLLVARPMLPLPTISGWGPLPSRPWYHMNQRSSLSPAGGTGVCVSSRCSWVSDTMAPGWSERLPETREPRASVEASAFARLEST